LNRRGVKLAACERKRELGAVATENRVFELRHVALETFEIGWSEDIGKISLAGPANDGGVLRRDDDERQAEVAIFDELAGETRARPRHVVTAVRVTHHHRGGVAAIIVERFGVFCKRRAPVDVVAAQICDVVCIFLEHGQEARATFASSAGERGEHGKLRKPVVAGVDEQRTLLAGFAGC